MRELDKVLNEDEKVFWEGRPRFLPFFFSSIIVSLFGLIFVWVGLPSFLANAKTGNPFSILTAFPFWIGILITVGIPLYTALVYKYVYYVITDKRVIIQGGLIGRDFEMVDFDQITNADVKMGILDKLFGRSSGSILISTAGTLTYTREGPMQKPYTLRHIKDPYEVFKFFKKVSYDVKTDIQFPNKYRSNDNPGYKSDYIPGNSDKPQN